MSKWNHLVQGLTLGVAIGVAALAQPSSARAAAAEPSAAAKVTTPHGLPHDERVRAWAQRPNWAGFWMDGTGIPGVLDTSTAEPRGPNAVRTRPPYTREYERKYAAHLAHAGKGIRDPIEYCMPVGMPRLLSQPYGVEFVINPEEVWMIWRDDAQVRRIFTDGRDHPPEDELFATWTGHSVGHWEGDTLVVDTIGLREHQVIAGLPDQTIDRTGGTLSDQAHISERIRMVDANTIENKVTIVDSLALTRPWSFTRLFKRAAPGEYASDRYCNERQLGVIVHGTQAANILAKSPGPR